MKPNDWDHVRTKRGSVFSPVEEVGVRCSVRQEAAHGGDLNAHSQAYNQAYRDDRQEEGRQADIEIMKELYGADVVLELGPA
jgi:hypothetical protein